MASVDPGSTRRSTSRYRRSASVSPRRTSHRTPARSSASLAETRSGMSLPSDGRATGLGPGTARVPTAMDASVRTGEPDDRADREERGDGQHAGDDAHGFDDVGDDVSARGKGGDSGDDPGRDPDRKTRHGGLHVVGGPARQQSDDDDREHDDEDDKEDGLHANLRCGRSMAGRRSRTGGGRVAVTNLYRSLSRSVGARERRWSTVSGCPSASHASVPPASSPSSPLASASSSSWPWPSLLRPPSPGMTPRPS